MQPQYRVLLSIRTRFVLLHSKGTPDNKYLLCSRPNAPFLFGDHVHSDKLVNWHENAVQASSLSTQQFTRISPTSMEHNRFGVSSDDVANKEGGESKNWETRYQTMQGTPVAPLVLFFPKIACPWKFYGIKNPFMFPHFPTFFHCNTSKMLCMPLSPHTFTMSTQNC